MERETGFSGRLLGAVRSLKKRVFPTGRELVVRKWKNDRGDQTLRLNYSLDANSVVMDMGGYRGDWAHEIHQRYGSQIHVFEPVMSFADAIKTRFSGNAAIHVHACGLADGEWAGANSLVRDLWHNRRINNHRDGSRSDPLLHDSYWTSETQSSSKGSAV